MKQNTYADFIINPQASSNSLEKDKQIVLKMWTSLGVDLERQNFFIELNPNWQYLAGIDWPKAIATFHEFEQQCKIVADNNLYGIPLSVLKSQSPTAMNLFYATNSADLLKNCYAGVSLLDNIYLFLGCLLLGKKEDFLNLSVNIPPEHTSNPIKYYLNTILFRQANAAALISREKYLQLLLNLGTSLNPNLKSSSLPNATNLFERPNYYSIAIDNNDFATVKIIFTQYPVGANYLELCLQRSFNKECNNSIILFLLDQYLAAVTQKQSLPPIDNILQTRWYRGFEYAEKDRKITNVEFRSQVEIYLKYCNKKQIVDIFNLFSQSENPYRFLYSDGPPILLSHFFKNKLWINDDGKKLLILVKNAFIEHDKQFPGDKSIEESNSQTEVKKMIDMHLNNRIIHNQPTKARIALGLKYNKPLQT